MFGLKFLVRGFSEVTLFGRNLSMSMGIIFVIVGVLNGMIYNRKRLCLE